MINNWRLRRHEQWDSRGPTILCCPRLCWQTRRQQIAPRRSEVFQMAALCAQILPAGKSQLVHVGAPLSRVTRQGICVVTSSPIQILICQPVFFSSSIFLRSIELNEIQFRGFEHTSGSIMPLTKEAWWAHKQEPIHGVSQLWLFG